MLSSRNTLTQRELGYWVPDIPDEVSITHYGPETRQGIESILVPVAGGPNSAAAIEVAVTIAHEWDATLAMLTVVPATCDESKRCAADARLRDYADQIEHVPVDRHTEHRDDVVTTITGHSREHELIVIGASEESLFKRVMFDPIPAQLAERTDAPILVIDSAR